jgi:hypothetical protein
MERIIHDPPAVHIPDGRSATLSGFNNFARFLALASCNHRPGSASNKLWRQRI